MSPYFLLFTLLLSSASALTRIRFDHNRASNSATSSAAPTETPSHSPKPICFTPPDRHPVSETIKTCSTLLDDFIESFGDRMNTRLRWTGNNSETGQGMVHLPQVATRRNRDKTGACLIEVVDRGAGDVYSAMSIKGPGLRILRDCFSNEECGEVALPPRGTTTLAICGSYAPNGTSLLRRPVAPLADSENVRFRAVALD